MASVDTGCGDRRDCRGADRWTDVAAKERANGSRRGTGRRAKTSGMAGPQGPPAFEAGGREFGGGAETWQIVFECARGDRGGGDWMEGGLCGFWVEFFLR